MDLPEEAYFFSLCVSSRLIFLFVRRISEEFWEDTAYHNDGGLFLHSIAAGFPSRIQIKYPAESHEHDALLS